MKTHIVIWGLVGFAAGYFLYQTLKGLPVLSYIFSLTNSNAGGSTTGAP